MDCKKMGFATRQIHAGKHDNGVGALCTPIYQTSTFEFDTVQQGGARFAGQEEGYIYSRLGNPSLTQVEEKLAALEGGEAALATASGMGAISSALWSSVEAGDEIQRYPVWLHLRSAEPWHEQVRRQREVRCLRRSRCR